MSAIDTEVIDLLKEGQRVVLMGSETFSELPTSFQPSVTGRTNGNLATVIYD